MKKFLVAAAVALALSSITPVAFAANAQNEKMTDCNARAKTDGMKGAARRAFMKSCLSGDEAKMSQQEKMTKCNADAKTKALKGADRKAFMKSCLSG